MRLRLVVVLSLVGLVAVPAAGVAFFGNGARIVSASLERQEQGDDSTQFVDVSADGRAVAMQTRASNFYADDDADPDGISRIGGVFVRDVDGGGVRLVADGDQLSEDDATLRVGGARSPSVSADGRFVVFSTEQQLVALDRNASRDVYRRDMTVAVCRPLPDCAPNPYVLVSAQDRTDLPATYGDTGDTPGRIAGSDVWPSTSISDDGNRIVFRTDANSSLPAGATASTPPRQLFVRDVDARTTTLLTRARADGAPAGGAASAAVISADGTTAVWVGQNAPAQTRFVDGEFADEVLPYYLWRRFEDGADAPTRRITGPSDPDDPSCGPGGSVDSNPTSTGPCFGPLTGPEGSGGIGGRAPGVSADGYTVAFLAGAAARPTTLINPNLDLFVTSMRPGVSRKAGTRELTREGDDDASSATLEQVAMSHDGRHLAVTTARTRFILPVLRAIGPTRPVPDARSLYVVDLAQGTIEAALRSFGGGDPNGDVTGIPTITRSGDRVAFTSDASNLFFGDANARADAFTIDRRSPLVAEAPPEVPPGLNEELPTEQEADPPDITLRVLKVVRTGEVRVEVRTPEAGAITVTARGNVRVSRGAAKARTVSRATAVARGAGRSRLTLKLARKYARELRRRKRLTVEVRASFAPRRPGPRLVDELDATFRQVATRRKASKRRSSSRRPGERSSPQGRSSKR